MAIQTVLGKAFEYACLQSFYEHICTSQEVCIVSNSTLNVAKDFYLNTEPKTKEKLDLGAKAAVDVILKMEPCLENQQNSKPLYLSLQEDARGKEGDVRDILAVRKQNEWEIGISCKHNHSAVKHSRLSQNIDFGNSWFNIPCSKDYFEEIQPLFDRLKKLKESNAVWSNVENKEKTVYIPLLNAFLNELQKLDKQNPGEIPKRFLKYLLGVNDFYKVISLENRKVTQIQAFSLYGTLNRPAGSVKPQVKLPQLVLPNKFYSLEFKKGSGNTILAVCDEGWTISLRIHNASSKVEPSLKFDVTLKGTPNIYTHHEPWK